MPKKTDKTKEKVVEAKIVKNSLKGPRITEKASDVLEKNNVYTFDVAINANKKEVAKDIFAQYKVKPVKVNIVKSKQKSTISRSGLRGKIGASKKAMVYLKKGDKIELV